MGDPTITVIFQKYVVFFLIGIETLFESRM